MSRSTMKAAQVPELPVLTEVLGDQSGAPLTDAQCRQLAALLAPQLEAMLREKFALQFEGMWQESWREVENNLPELIRDKMAAPSRRRPK